VGERVATLDIDQVVERRRALTLVNADRQTERLGLLVDREEVGVVQSPVAFDPAEEDAAGAPPPAI
jgi:hypothetical protein